MQFNRFDTLQQIIGQQLDVAVVYEVVLASDKTAEQPTTRATELIDA